MGAVVNLVRGGITRAPKTSPRRAAQQTAASGAAFTYDGKIPIADSRVLRHWAKHSEWIRGAINIRKSQVASAEWDIVPLDKDASFPKRVQKDLRAKFRSPNPANDSWRSFIEPIIEDLLTLDAGCVEKERNLMGQLINLWPVDAAKIKVNALWDGSDPEQPRYFWYPDGWKETERFTNEDFMYMMAHRRTDSPIGTPPLETLKLTIEAEMAAHEYNRRQVAGAAPDGVMNLGEGFTPNQVKEFMSYFDSEVAGRSAVGFIGGTKGPSWIPFRGSNRDMQFLEWQIYLVRKICVVLGLTPQDLGVTFDVNRSTAETQIQISEDRGLRPLMTLIQEYLTQEIVWDKSFGGSGNNLAFRFTALNLKESTAKAAIYEKALAGVPWRFINEARIDEGRQPIPELDGKLIMSTPTGAVDIMDIPTVREMFDAQNAAAEAKAKAKPPADKNAEYVEIAGNIVKLLPQQKPPEVHIDKGAVEVNFQPPAINVTTPEVVVHQPHIDVKSPDITIQPPNIEVRSPDVVIHQAPVTIDKGAVQVTVEAQPPAPIRKVSKRVTRDADGRVTGIVEEESNG